MAKKTNMKQKQCCNKLNKDVKNGPHFKKKIFLYSSCKSFYSLHTSQKSSYTNSWIVANGFYLLLKLLMKFLSARKPSYLLISSKKSQLAIFKFEILCWRVKVKVSQSCLTLCDPMDYTVLGILQARLLEWAAFPFSMGSSQPRAQTQVSCIAGWFFTSRATRKAQEYWSGQPIHSPGDLPDPGIELGFPASQADSLSREASISWTASLECVRLVFRIFIPIPWSCSTF